MPRARSANAAILALAGVKFDESAELGQVVVG
jgi:hypothetical protein